MENDGIDGGGTPLGAGGWSAASISVGGVKLEGVIVHDAVSGRELTKFLRRANRIRLPEAGATVATIAHPFAEAHSPGASLNDRSARPLSVVSKTYLSDLKKRGVREIYCVRLCLRQLMVATGGDISAGEITDDHVREFSEVLRWWPGSLSKSKEYRDLSDQALYALGKELNVEPPSRRYIKGATARLRTFFNHLVSSRIIKNSPMDGFKNDRPDYTETESRRAFTSEEIEQIFDPETYLPWAKKYPHRFWGPLIGLHTGARVAEVAQIKIADVVQDGEIWCFKFRATPDRDLPARGGPATRGSMKTAVSIRTVPIHPALIDLGFLDYFKDARESGHARLFPNLPSGSAGKADAESGKAYGAALGSQFSDYLRKVASLEKGMGFHAFRHTIDTNLEDQGAPLRLIASISGHGKASRQREYEADLATMRNTYCHQSTPAFREMQFAALTKFEPTIRLARYQRGQFAWAFGPDARQYP